MTLDHSDHLDWLALLRVRGGDVSKLDDDRYVYRGKPFPDVSLVAVALQGLERAGLLTLAEPDEHGLATVALTEAGLARFKALIKRQRAEPDVAMTDGPGHETANPGVIARRRRTEDRTIPSTCTTHSSGRGFCNLRVTRGGGGDVVLNPHVDGSCLITLDEDGAVAMRDLLIEWFGPGSAVAAVR